jgi:hypothetical protein
VPAKLLTHTTNQAESTGKIQFDRDDVESEIIALGNQASEIYLPALKSVFGKIKKDDWIVRDEITLFNQSSNKTSRHPRARRFKVLAKSFGEFLCHGPGGKAYAGYDPKTIAALEARIVEHPDPEKKGQKINLHHGSSDEWMGASSQKSPRFDNRILNECALIPRLHVCKVLPKLKWNKELKCHDHLDEESLLPSIVTFLMKLINMRVDDPSQKRQRGLDVDEINQIYEDVLKNARAVNVNQDKWEVKVVEKFKITGGSRGRWQHWCEKFGVKAVTKSDERATSSGDNSSESAASKQADEEGSTTKKSKDAVEAPKLAGRSRFSKPALKLVKELILTGKTPLNFWDELIAPESPLAKRLALVIQPDAGDAPDGPQQRKLQLMGITWSDLNFLKQIWKPESPNEPYEICRLYLPNQRLEQLTRGLPELEKSLSVLRREARERGHCEVEIKNNCPVCRSEKAISELIGSQNDPIVRHRLETFWKRLRELEMEHGEPHEIVLEFVRGDADDSWLGKQAKKDYQTFIDDNRDARERAKKVLGGNPPASLITRYLLWEAQGGECLYGTPVKVAKEAECLYFLNTALKFTGLSEYHIDHIVPRALGGPDAFWNWVLTTTEANELKGDRVPYVWFHEDRPKEWEAYCGRVFKHAKGLRRRKIDLLLRADAASLVGSKYTALAETAWIAKLAQTIVRLHFGWPLDHQGGKERVNVISGGLTARVRRNYFLNSLLGNQEELDRKIDETLKKLDAARAERSANDNEDHRDKVRLIRSELDELKNAAEKDRSDPRHHALDAMILSFLPQWARNRDQEDFFRFDEIGDNPVFASRDLKNIAILKREISDLEKGIYARFKEIKAASDEEKKAALKKQLSEQRKNLAQRRVALDHSKQPRNFLKVRDWFRRQLNQIEQGGLKGVVPRYLHSLKPQLEKWHYRRAFIPATDEETGQFKQDSFVLHDLPLVPKLDAKGKPTAEQVFDYKMLCRRIHHIIPHGVKKPDYEDKVLRKWLDDQVENLRRQKPAKEINLQDWVAICENKQLPWLAQPKRNQAPREVKVCRLEEKFTTRSTATQGRLYDLAFKSGVFKEFRPDELDANIADLVYRPDHTKRDKKQKPSNSADAQPQWVPNTDLQNKFNSPEFRMALGAFFQAHPHYTAVVDESREKGKKEALKKSWNDAWKVFLAEQKISGMKTDIKTHEADPSKPQAKLVRFEEFFLHVYEAKFDSGAGLDAIGSICDPWIRQQVRSFLERKPSPDQWKAFSDYFVQVKKSCFEAFLKTNPACDASALLGFYRDALAKRGDANAPKDARGGSHITHVHRVIGHDPAVYPDLSKDKTGIHVTSKGNRGYFPYKITSTDGEGKTTTIYGFRVVRAFESPRGVKEELLLKTGLELLDTKEERKQKKMWKNKMLFVLPNSVSAGKTKVDAGFYILDSIQNEASAYLVAPNGQKIKNPIGLKKLLESGFRRYDEQNNNST